MAETENGKTFTLVYRLMLDGEPTYMSLKALKMADMDENLIIGITNIDEQKRAELEFKQAFEENITYSNQLVGFILLSPINAPKTENAIPAIPNL